MHYNLLSNYRGFVSDRQSVFCDLAQDVVLSFSLPDKEQYVAVLTDDRGLREQLAIKDNRIRLPAHMLRPQYVQIYVEKVENGKAVKTYPCEPFRINRLTDTMKTQFELCGAMSENDVRVIVGEQAQTIADLKNRLEALEGESNGIRAERLALAAYEDRISAIEQNLKEVNAIIYDPAE